MHNEEYCIGYNFLEASESFREDGLEPITLAVHGTSEMMEMIERKPSNWDGPISLALFIDYHSQGALEYLSDVHRCDQEFRRKATTTFENGTNLKDLPGVEYRNETVGSFELYPSNLMRNIARRGAKSDIHFIADIDMIMSGGFATKVKQISNAMVDGKSKKVLVVRRFESNQTAIPTDHKQLFSDVNNKKTFEFHHKFFFSGHRIPNISHWFAVSNESDTISAWKIPYENSGWEVQVILHRKDPYNADYFPARVRVMQSLIYNLCRANYSFNLLSHVFDVHEGIKLNDTDYSRGVIAHSKKYGRKKAYNRYVNEMNTAYPSTLGRCGNFVM
ncbi:hypothetical protein GCK72_000669 [Caenorhabditis remanei]|uniref:Uncharacterized protein n=1 Tax=Caenorhabditis remanei TaxID=31234 RepID=A0A6A5HQA9_CAERE|nr:hypothetical protein GCK72_000669 [Caenorhabditis remanei]KAF1768856.1 hypothetical protein GCK72_000669 [Caenorhabditis remanei]